jgi:hypothetical protein
MVSPLIYSGTSQSTTGLPGWVSMMMVMDVSDYFHNCAANVLLKGLSQKNIYRPFNR